MAWALSHAGYNIEVAQDGLSALNAMRTFGPDLVLLDIKLPHLDGFQLCEMLRGKAEYNCVPIVMLSGLSSEADIQRAFDAGADDYITKPVGDQKLLTIIEEQLARVASDGGESSQRRMQ